MKSTTKCRICLKKVTDQPDTWVGPRYCGSCQNNLAVINKDRTISELNSELHLLINEGGQTKQINRLLILWSNRVIELLLATPILQLKSDLLYLKKTITPEVK